MAILHPPSCCEERVEKRVCVGVPALVVSSHAVSWDDMYCVYLVVSDRDKIGALVERVPVSAQFL